MIWSLHDAKGDAERQTEVRLAELNELNGRLETIRAELDDPGASKTIEQFAALDRSGILTTMTPDRVLSEIARLLPDEARVVSLRLRADSSQGELELDAVTADPQAAVSFLGGLTESSLVRQAEVLEETPASGGKFFYRIVAELGE